jgi:selenide,water dikinase
MNLLAFPCSLGPDVVAEVLRGGGDVCREAGAVVVGGHTIDDDEPKFGLSVMGVVHPGKVIRNTGARPGDVLFLTKPLGTGVIGTALKRGLEDGMSARGVIESMAALNRGAAEAMQEVGIHAGTDVTGFGIAGHLHEMLVGSGCAARLDFSALPIFDGVLEYAAQGVVPGRTADVIAYAADFVEWLGRPAPLIEADADAETLAMWRVLCDPQTSGGILASVPPEKADEYAAALESRGVTPSRVGAVVDGRSGRIVVS